MNDIFLDRYPQLDLHGEDRDSAKMMTNDFVSENYSLGNETICIVHGVGTGIVKKACHEALSVNKKVSSYKTDYFNHGMTIVTLKLK